MFFIITIVQTHNAESVCLCGQTHIEMLTVNLSLCVATLSSCLSMQVAGKLEASDKEKIEKEVEGAISWLDQNQLAEKDELEHKLKELEGACSPIISKMYQGGAPGMHTCQCQYLCETFMLVAQRSDCSPFLTICAVDLVLGSSCYHTSCCCLYCVVSLVVELTDVAILFINFVAIQLFGKQVVNYSTPGPVFIFCPCVI